MSLFRVCGIDDVAQLEKMSKSGKAEAPGLDVASYKWRKQVLVADCGIDLLCYQATS